MKANEWARVLKEIAVEFKAELVDTAIGRAWLSSRRTIPTSTSSSARTSWASSRTPRPSVAGVPESDVAPYSRRGETWALTAVAGCQYNRHTTGAHTPRLEFTMNHKIHSSLAHLAVPITSLTPDPRNARAHDERNLAAVVESFNAHGQVKPIVVQLKSDAGKPMVIRAGNASTEAASRMGWTHIAAVVLDVPDKEAKAYGLRDNRTADLAEWDLPNLGAELRDLRDQGVDVSTLGWEPFEYEPLMEAEWKPPANTGEEFDTPGKGTSIKFSDDQIEALKTAMGGRKVTADGIVARLTAQLSDAN